MPADQPPSRAGETPSRKIAADLRAAIDRGDYKPGHQLPSGTALMQQYGVARQTVQNAFDLLKAEGRVVTRPGAGVFVKERPMVRRLTRSRLAKDKRRAGRGWFLGDAAESGFTPTVEVAVRREPADQHTADALDLELGDEVVVRDRVMRADGVVVMTAVSRFPAAIAAGTRIEEEDPGEGGSWAVLEELGHEVMDAVEIVRTHPATDAEAEQLGLEVGLPVLDITRVAYDGSNRPLEVNDMVLTGDRYELVYEIRTD